MFRTNKFKYGFLFIAAILVGAAFYIAYGAVGASERGLGMNKGYKNILAMSVKKEREVAIKAPIEALEFSPDGEDIAALSRDEKISIWRWKGNLKPQILQLASGASTSVTREPIRFSPDGRFFAVCHGTGAGDVVVRIWDAKTWQVIHEILDEMPGGCTALDFSPNSEFLLHTNFRVSKIPGDTVSIYEVGTWKKKWGRRTIPFYPYTMRVSPSGDAIALGGDLSHGNGEREKHQLIILNLSDGEQRKIIGNTVSFLPGKLQWNPDGGNIAVFGRPVRKKPLGNNDLSHDDLESFMIFDTISGMKIKSGYEGALGFQFSLRYSFDGKYLLQANDSGLKNDPGLQIWDGHHDNILLEIKGNVGAIAISRDGRFIAYGESNKIVILKISN